MNGPDPAIQRLAIRTPNWLGDVVMALPAIAAVRDAYSAAELTIVAPASIAPMFEEHTPARQQHILVVDKAGEAEALRQRRLDAILLLPNSFRTGWTARRGGVRERWGYRVAGRAPLLTRAVKRPKGAVHQSQYYSALVRGLGIDVADIVPRISPTERTKQRAAALLTEHLSPNTKLVGFAPGAAYGHAKRWPPERVAEVIRHLAQEDGAACVLVGAPADREAGRAIESTLPAGVPVINLIGRTDLRLLIGVLARCAAFVSNDSGAMHLAAAVGVPVTAIFGPTREKATAPLGDPGEHDVILEPVFCRPCMLRECPIDHRCMKRIPPETVLASVRRRL